MGRIKNSCFYDSLSPALLSKVWASAGTDQAGHLVGGDYFFLSNLFISGVHPDDYSNGRYNFLKVVVR